MLVFVASGCPHCDALLADLDRRRVSYRAVDLRTHPEAVAELAGYTRERRVPVVVDHEVVSIGFGGLTSDLAAFGLCAGP